MTGAPLDESLVRAARDLEMQFFDKMGVYAEKLPESQVKARGGKVIS